MHNIIQVIESQLHAILPDTEILVAISGGCDSMVLLDAVIQWQQHRGVPRLIKAVHINHQLHPQADEWATFCQQRCAAYDVPIDIIKVTVDTEGVSIEASAREARYRALKSLMHEQSVCLLAHHENDQAETLLLQCLRGAGPRGLAAMPAYTEFASGQLVRPLLSLTQQTLMAYAQARQLVWIEDPSNSDVRYDRNFLRTHVFPLLQQRWPSCTSTFARAAQLCAQSISITDDTIRLALLQVTLPSATALSISALTVLTPELQSEVVRAWLKTRGYPVPQRRHWQQIQSILLTAKHNPTACIVWNGYVARRYRDALWIEPYTFFNTADLSQQEVQWRGESSIVLPINLGNIDVQITEGEGLCYREHYTLRFHQQGQRFHPSARQGSHPLKKCFQEWGIAPWLRPRIPLIYHDQKLVAVVGYAVSEQYLAKNGEKGLLFSHVLYPINLQM